MIQKIKNNPYLDSKEYFKSLSNDEKNEFLESLFEIFTQKTIIFSKFLESHPYFENYILKQNLNKYNLSLLENNLNIIYSAMQVSQNFLPSVVFNDILDSKQTLCIIPYEPFSESYRSNILAKINKENITNTHFFICKQAFLNEIKEVIEMQNLSKNPELDSSFLDNLLNLAQRFYVSDIHLTLDDNNKLGACLFRIDGSLVHFLYLHNELFYKLSKKLKLLCKLDINKTRIPQDGHFKRETKNVSLVQNDIRISFLPILNGESIVLRIPSSNKRFHNIESLNMSEEILSLLKNNLLAKSGLILVSGPTNSAKSTLLYNCLRFLHDGSKKIISLEDPIEQEIKGIVQCEIDNNANFTFEIALKYVLRQDPDIIMIGEIRDIKTLDLALKAALSGHLVLASIHSSDCDSTLSRLIDLGAKKALLDSTLKCIISQRLLKTLCPFCKEKKEDKFIAIGCHKCYHQGFGKRKLIQEMLDFRNIKDSKHYYTKSLQTQANELYKQGIITYEESLL